MEFIRKIRLRYFLQSVKRGDILLQNDNQCVFSCPACGSTNHLKSVVVVFTKENEANITKPLVCKNCGFKFVILHNWVQQILENKNKLCA